MKKINLNKEKLTLLKFDGKDNTLYITLKNDSNMTLYGIELNNGIVYKLADGFEYKKIYKHNGLKNKKIEYISDVINDIICKKLDAELKLYKLIHLYDFDFYTLEFCYDIRDRINEEIPIYNTFGKYYNLDLREINNNYIIVKSNYSADYFIVNLKTNDVEFYHNAEKINILKYYFNQDFLNLMVAKEQYKLGILPNDVKEFIKMNEFLKDKSSVRIITKDDNEYTLKTRFSGQKLSNLIGLYNNRFEISSYYIGAKEDLNLKDIKCLKYGRKEHIFDGNCITALCGG